MGESAEAIAGQVTGGGMNGITCILTDHLIKHLTWELEQGTK